ncbi:putative U6 snRNA-associated sm family protein Lsm2 [Toxoplasma gondii MAS]|uniref:U6 snRNA-associated Sm-like protein LSm2 n=2 Tax=Toxoplasma gondii TaxID=5811 RepID=A0A086PW48_TOXGO|nr:putative U6 snRNA-associated sm family protein Lsm2 [Toxoplasma gondii MAS]PUA84681.1 putative U6 snRNA-associated sm family protein Lsm2 [Toxoplasma gondii TgCATBr9]
MSRHRVLSMFFSFFQTLVERQTQIMVELKNDLQITGSLHSVDQFLNIKLNNVSVADPERCPHLLSVKNCFIRGSAVRYVHLPPSAVDVSQLQDMCRRESAGSNDRDRK